MPILLAVALLIGGLVFLGQQNRPALQPEQTACPPPSTAPRPLPSAMPAPPSAAPLTPEPALEAAQETAPAPEPASAPTPAPDTTPASIPTPDELLKRYQRYGLDARPEIEEGLAALLAQDPAWGELWTKIFEKSFYVNQEPDVSEDVPAGLPEDDSLCIVVFGFELRPDGSMRSELIGRCEAALACAEEYPNAYVAVTGGATAAGNIHTTEAGAMSRYFIAHGIEEERLIVERRSRSTADNAVNLNAILTEQYPQIKSLVVVSSSYHVPLCTLLLEETALFDAYLRGDTPYAVVAQMGFYVEKHLDCASPSVMASDVRSVASRMMKK